MKQYDCLDRLLGRCQCTPDYDPNHHPNNYDCPKYYPAYQGMGNVITFVPELARNIIEEMKAKNETTKKM